MIDVQTKSNLGLTVESVPAVDREEDLDTQRGVGRLLAKMLRPLRSRGDEKAAIRHRDLLQALQNPQRRSGSESLTRC